jgi:large conductance mechanosensitive channel
MLKEFRDFAMRGNVVDLAIGVIIGAAFGTIVSSLVDDIIMPPIGLAMAGIDFSKLAWIIKAAVPAVTDATGAIISPEQAAVSINYGKFINATIKFIIVAWVLFLIVKGMNSMKKAEAAAPAAPPEPTASEKLLGEIRDLLKK